MKKLVKLLTCVALVAGSTAAMADSELKPYVGAEVGFSKIRKGSDIKNQANLSIKDATQASIAPIVGLKITDHIATEVGYQQLGGFKIKDSTNNVEQKISANNWFVDAVGTLPVADQVDLLASVGAGVLRVKAKGQTIYQGTGRKAGLRAGAGVQYKLTDNLAARAMVRYQDARIKTKRGVTKETLTNDLTSATLGVVYTF